MLIAQRPAHKHLPLAWEFPGGKVEVGEDPEAALRREIREELGADIEIVRPLSRFRHEYPRVTIEMIPFVARLRPGSPEPQALEHLALKWVTRPELTQYDLAPADWPVVRGWQ